MSKELLKKLEHEVLYLASLSKAKTGMQAETTENIQYDVARFLFGDKILIKKHPTLFGWALEKWGC